MSEEFQIRIGVNSSGVATGINSAIGQVRKLSESVHSLVEAFGIKEVIQSAIEKSIEWGAQINKDARANGIGVESFQELGAAAKEMSIDVSDATTAFKKIQIAQVDALKGNADLQKAFERRGISMDKLRKMTPMDAYKAVGESFEKAPPSAQATADAVVLMGKNGVAMLGAFKGGFIGAMKEAEELGEVLKEDVIKSLVRADDAMTRFGLQAKVAIASMLPPLIDLTGQILNATQATILWLQTWWSTKGTKQQSFNEANKAVDSFFEAQTKLARETAKYQKPEKPKNPDDVIGNGNANSIAKPESDKLLSIGGYRGGGEIARIPGQQLSVLHQINGGIQRIAHYADKPTPEADKIISGLNEMVRILTPLTQEGVYD